MEYFEEIIAHAAPCALTVGTFDGVHRGHAGLTDRLRTEAAARGLQTAVLTFADMPYFYFAPEKCSRLLTLPSEKRAAFADLGIDRLTVIPFDARIAERSAESFVLEELVGKLNARLLVIGPDFALGKGRAGNVETLRVLGDKHGFEVIVLEGKVMDDGPISSTRIRELLEDGHAHSAARLLGRPFGFTGEVVSGQQLGRTIGFPTLNLKTAARKVLPGNAVYAVQVCLSVDETEVPLRPEPGSALPGAMNIGVRPTVDGTRLAVEVHVIDRRLDFTPQNVRVYVVERLREERKFAGLPELAAQLQTDIELARDLLGQSP